MCYAFLTHFTGNSSPPHVPVKRPRKYALRPNEDGVLVDERVTRQQEKDAAREAARTKVKVTAKRKGKHARQNYKHDMDSVSYAEMRQSDWFVNEEREEGLRNFWCAQQKHVYDDIYMTMGKPVRPMHPINMGQLRRKVEFGEAVEVTGKMGLHHLMSLKCDFNITLLKQFYATLVMKGDEARTMKWMSGDVYCTATFIEFGELLGYDYTNNVTPSGIRLHGPERTDKMRLASLYG